MGLLYEQYSSFHWYLKDELDDKPICFKGRLGQKEKLKAVPNWQERLREFVDELIKDVDN
ncbi:hypothetical protein [Nostoc sp.]|uniref:hypothetical protein n=1 Tax=Nostoc sp. TaxID=1180 RepID=UPI002FF7EC3E|nr:hypothetical protein [Nostoc sp. NMS9]